MASFLNWASENISPSSLSGAMSWAEKNVKPEQLQAMKDVAEKEVKEALNKDMGVSNTEGSSSESWTSWIKGAPAAAAAPPTKPLTQKQRAVRFAVRNWKYSVPIGMSVFTWLMSWLWWVAIIAAVVLFLLKKKQA